MSEVLATPSVFGIAALPAGLLLGGMVLTGVLVRRLASSLEDRSRTAFDNAVKTVPHVQLIIEPEQPLFRCVENGKKNRGFEGARRMEPAIRVVGKMAAAFVIVNGHANRFEAELALNVADARTQSFLQ